MMMRLYFLLGTDEVSLSFSFLLRTPRCKTTHQKCRRCESRTKQGRKDRSRPTSSKHLACTQCHVGSFIMYTTMAFTSDLCQYNYMSASKVPTQHRTCALVHSMYMDACVIVRYTIHNYNIIILYYIIIICILTACVSHYI